MKPLFAWRTAIVQSDLKATTKQVLIFISLRMNEKGESAFPSVKRIAQDTSLSKDTVTRCLKLAKDTGWIKVVSRYKDGGLQTSNGYQPSVPKGWNLTPPAEKHPPHKSGTHSLHEQGTSPPQKHSPGPPQKQGTNTSVITPINTSKNSSLNEKEKKEVPQEEMTDWSFYLSNDFDYILPVSLYNELCKNHTGVNINDEMRKASRWCLENEPNIKDSNGMMKFLNNWLSNARPEEKVHYLSQEEYA